MLIKDFLPTASSQQKEVIGEIMRLDVEWREASDQYREKQEKIDSLVADIRYDWFGTGQTQMINMDLEFFVDPLLPARNNAVKRVNTLAGKLKVLYHEAVYDLGMGHLDYFGRNYEHLMKEPLPSAT